MIVATAGHVDHGKTSLVKQLSGVDTDRLEEEKRRGLSINLGFAYQRIGDDASIGFIDVPGHNRFINTMISGVSGIDLALLVVAADDGPMPQTTEHLEVLRLLGVSDFILVITRIDRVEPPRVDEVSSAMQEILATACPVFPVNNLDGTGIAELREYLYNSARQSPAKSDSGHFRLSIDRSFGLQGAGLVVTGTVISGSVSIGDSLQLLPRGLPVRVRSIHAQDEQAQTGRAGQRCALNITGVDRAQINRGDALQSPEIAQASDRIDVRFELLPGVPFALKHMSPVKLYLGASRLPAKLYLLEKPQGGNKLIAGSSVLARLIVSGEIASCRGDRFLLRDDSESLTLGGGVVLDGQAPQSTKRRSSRLSWLAAMEAETVESALQQLLFEQNRLLDLTAFRQNWNLREEESERVQAHLSLVNRLKIFTADGIDYVVAVEKWEVAEQAVIRWMEVWHDENPRLDGAQLKLLRADVEPTVEAVLFLAVVSTLIKLGRLKLAGGMVSLPGHEVSLSTAELNQWRVIEQALDKYGTRIPVLSELKKELPLDEQSVNQALRLAVKEGRAYQLGKKRFILSKTINELANSVNELAQSTPEFSVIDFKNHVGLGRNLAIELMEYFDSIRFTARHGDHRLVVDPELPGRLFKAG